MVKDDRLFAPFDVGLPEHPKVIGLSDGAFRAMVEAILYARRSLSDGFLDERVVLRKWGQDVADELTSNDPERPTWVRIEGGWQIHDFEKHHTTRADIEAKRAVRAEAGRKGGMRSGQVRREKRADEATAKQTRSKTNPETETETETTTSNEVVTPLPPDRFDEFYAVWPKKVDKPAAKRAWTKAIKRESAEAIIAAAVEYRDNPHIPPRQFIRNPATWLNGDGWNDELPTARGDSKPTPTERALHTVAAGAQLNRRRTLGNVTTINPRKELW